MSVNQLDDAAKEDKVVVAWKANVIKRLFVSH